MTKKGMIFIIIIIVLMVVFVLWETSLWASTYYCDPSAGSNDNNGLTPETAWASLESAWDSKMGSTVVSGDTVKLMNGYNGVISKDQTFEITDYITIEPADGHTASLGEINIKGAEYYYFHNLTISPEADGEWNYLATIITLKHDDEYGNCHHIKIEDCNIYTRDNPTDWTLQEFDENVGKGIWIKGGYHTISRNNIRVVSEAIYSSAGFLTITYNTITKFTQDGIYLGEADSCNVEYNLIQGCVDYDPAGHHQDAIQIFNGGAVTNLTIRGNRIYAYLPDFDFGRGSLQGICNFVDTYENSGWTIENNLVVLYESIHGIVCENTHDSQIVNNTVVKYPGGTFSPKIRLTDGCTNIDVINNICSNWDEVEGSTILNNFDMDSYSFTNEFINYANLNFHLKSTSNFVNAGTTTQAPSIDVEQNPRDSVPDAGAYEYQGKYLLAIKE